MVKNIKIKFENKIILSAILITSIPLIISYIIFVNDKINDFDNKIKDVLKNTAFIMTQNDMVRDNLYHKKGELEIQNYAKTLISRIDDVDLIVICDMDGRKYSHLDESQIGEIFVNPDKYEVLTYGTSYYSLMEGSMGKTLRWFEPIFYNDEQVGFVMVGKYYNDIISINSEATFNYIALFLVTFILALIFSRVFACLTKKSILDMEPEEIAKLYNEKNIIINNCRDGIMALDENNNITILGNLIENAYEACTENEIKDKKVEVIMHEDERKISILVSDNGIPLKLNESSIFLEGISSKGTNRGTGLYLVKNRVDLYDGNIAISK